MAKAAKASRASKGTASVKWDQSRGVWVASKANPIKGATPRTIRAYHTLYDQALEKLDNKIERIKLGLPADEPKGTVKEWLETHLEQKKKRRAHSTWRNDANKLNHYVIPRIGPIKLLHLTEDHLNEMYDEIVAEIAGDGKHDGLATVNQIHRILRHAFNVAHNKGMIPRNPVKAAEVPEANPKERRALTADQGMHLLRTTYENNHPFLVPLAIMLFTGVRVGEAVGVTWDRVNLSTKMDGTGGAIDVTWQVTSVTKQHGCGDKNDDDSWPCGKTRGWACPQAHVEFPTGKEYIHLHGANYLSRPKTSASLRLLPMTPQLNAFMTWQAPKTQTLAGNTGNFVTIAPDISRGPNTPRCIAPKAGWAMFKECLEMAGLPTDVKQHEMRHTTASLLHEAGVDPETIQMILGHTSIATTKIYMHINQVRAAAAFATLDEMMNLGLPGPNLALSA